MRVCFHANCVYSHRCASPLRETMIHASPPGFFLFFLIRFNPIFYPSSAGVCMCVCVVSTHVCLCASEGYGGWTVYLYIYIDIYLYIDSCCIFLPLSSFIPSHFPFICPVCKSGLINVFGVYLIYLGAYPGIWNAAGLHRIYFPNMLCHYPPML